jgi:putative endonuclease
LLLLGPFVCHSVAKRRNLRLPLHLLLLLLLLAPLFVIPQRSEGTCGCRCICPCSCSPFCLSFRSEAKESAAAVAFALAVARPFVCHSAAKRRNLRLHLPTNRISSSTMPPREYHFYVYIMASYSHDLYIGFTNNIFRRVAEHRTAPPGTYTARYNIKRLVYYEHFTYVLNAIAREKQLKDWNREKKLALIEGANPT